MLMQLYTFLPLIIGLTLYLKDELLGDRYNKEIELDKELDTTLVCKPINIIYINDTKLV